MSPAFYAFFSPPLGIYTYQAIAESLRSKKLGRDLHGEKVRKTKYYSSKHTDVEEKW